ncbi:MAG TPA: hypothetical protein VGV38_08320, partial [Pyrinomonadaceae bacterium]|nr:hypothetical protein [Pyrinomonadaceae bacterium]
MLSVFLKRVLPFALTLLVGMALGGFTNLFRTRTSESSSSVRTYSPPQRRGCSKNFDRLVLGGGSTGRLVSIQRQTNDGSWVPTRPVGPEIYELTTRPAVIRSRPEALYT